MIIGKIQSIPTESKQPRIPAARTGRQALDNKRSLRSKSKQDMFSARFLNFGIADWTSHFDTTLLNDIWGLHRSKNLLCFFFALLAHERVWIFIQWSLSSFLFYFFYVLLHPWVSQLPARRMRICATSFLGSLCFPSPLSPRRKGRRETLETRLRFWP